MNAPETKVIKALQVQARVQANSTEPRAKIEGALWQLFFELPAHELLRVRDAALAPSSHPELFDTTEMEHLQVAED